MQRRAIRRSHRFQRIFRHHTGFGTLRNSILAAMGATLVLGGCSDDDGETNTSTMTSAGSISGMGGSTNSGGVVQSGGTTAPNAGTSAGGTVSPSAGTPVGGSLITGGMSLGGTSTGGTATGGTATGGTAAGGTATGGSVAGGMPSAGAIAGGQAAGGQAAGGMAAGGMAAGGAMVPVHCDGAQPVLDPNNQPTGVEQCPDGSMNRVASIQCAPIVGTAACNPDVVPEEMRSCNADADCNEKPNGKCVNQGGGLALPTCGCQYPCETDADCDNGNVCVCAGVDGNSARCRPASCTTNADCASGECAVQTFLGCGSDTVVHCRTDNDACRSNNDCAGGGESCGYDGNAFSCQPVPVCGRPLKIDGVSRLGEHEGRSDWLGGARPRLDHLNLEERGMLTAWWQEVAALEYASVASFSRFNLQLMSLGAPPELLMETQKATLDEIEHAQLAYGLASAYAGEDLGPAPFNLTNVGIETDPAQVLRALLEEACVGEILGAAEAEVAAQSAEDPVVKAVYARIADEEGRHARLAWQSLQWMLDQRPELREQAIQWLNEIVAEHMNRHPLPTPHIPEKGLIGATERQAIFEDALMSVVLPCAEELGLKLKNVA